jgi:HTH-type transcriptional regulator/antitoxin HipB
MHPIILPIGKIIDATAMAKLAPQDITLPAAVGTVADIGALVEAMRKQQGLTQQDVSGLSGLGGRFLVDLEKGKPTIQMQKVMDVMALLGLELVVRKKGA